MEDFEPQDGVVRWVASQSPNPALQALMKEAERDRKTRPATPVQQSASWTYPLSSASAWHSSVQSPIDGSYHNLPMDPSRPLSSGQRKPLSSSASSANQPLCDPARPRSSSHTPALSVSSVSKPSHILSEEDEPEATTFIELLRDVSRQLDENSKKKQRLAARVKEKYGEHSLTRSASGFDDRRGSALHSSSARPLTKTSSTSAIGSMTRALEKVSSASMSDLKPEIRGRASAKTGGLGPSGVDHVSGKSTPTFLPSTNLNCDLKLVPAFPVRPSYSTNGDHSTARKASAQKSILNDSDSAMQDVIDLTETDTEWESPMSGSLARADTTMMQVDDEDSDNDAGMDVSFFQAEPTPQPRVAPPKPQPTQTRSSPPIQAQRARTGPPPLGMRRAPQSQPSQYSASQSSKNLTVPRFKPPLLANPGGTTNRNGSTTTGSWRPTSRGGAVKATVPKTTAREHQDADSSFDVSFGLDADALEEAMKAFD